MAVRARSGYAKSVFINCPFDAEYQPLFEAIIFTVMDCGFRARCAQEIDDSSQVRAEKIIGMIRECRLGIHDISRTAPDAITGLPRFNMPLELGLFLGAKRYGVGRQHHKRCLVLDREKYRYQQYCSDIAGQDIGAHGGEAEEAVRVVRDWLRNAEPKARVIIPGGAQIFQRYQTFQQTLPGYCAKFKLERERLIFNDYTTAVEVWLRTVAA